MKNILAVILLILVAIVLYHKGTNNQQFYPYPSEPIICPNPPVIIAPSVKLDKKSMHGATIEFKQDVTLPPDSTLLLHANKTETLFCGYVFPKSDNVRVIKAGTSFKIDWIENLKSFDKDINERFGNIKNLAILKVYNNKEFSMFMIISKADMFEFDELEIVAENPKTPVVDDLKYLLKIKTNKPAEPILIESYEEESASNSL